jgi:hypothetical protein
MQRLRNVMTQATQVTAGEAAVGLALWLVALNGVLPHAMSGPGVTLLAWLALACAVKAVIR